MLIVLKLTRGGISRLYIVKFKELVQMIVTLRMLEKMELARKLRALNEKESNEEFKYRVNNLIGGWVADGGCKNEY